MTPARCREQAEVLVEAGVDAILFETHRADQADAVALRERRRARRHSTNPGQSSGLAREGGRTGVRRLQDLGASVIGGNCQVGMAPRRLRWRKPLAGATALPLLARPSACLPGEPTASPESFAAAVPELLRLGVRFVGGCCGTTEAHVAAIRAACYDLPVSERV